MPASIILRLNAKALRAAKQRAAADCRSLRDYVERLIQRDLEMVPDLEVIAPSDIAEYKAIPLAGETRAERRRRDALFRAILKRGIRQNGRR